MTTIERREGALMTDDEIVEKIAEWQETAQPGDEMAISTYVGAGSKCYRGSEKQKRINIVVKMDMVIKDD